MTMTCVAPRSIAPPSERTVLLARDLAKQLDIISGWGTYVDDEFGLTEEERALWRVLQVIRDSLGDLEPRGGTASDSQYDGQKS